MRFFFYFQPVCIILEYERPQEQSLQSAKIAQWIKCTKIIILLFQLGVFINAADVYHHHFVA